MASAIKSFLFALILCSPAVGWCGNFDANNPYLKVFMTFDDGTAYDFANASNHITTGTLFNTTLVNGYEGKAISFAATNAGVKMASSMSKAFTNGDGSRTEFYYYYNTVINASNRYLINYGDYTGNGRWYSFFRSSGSLEFNGNSNGGYGFNNIVLTTATWTLLVISYQTGGVMTVYNVSPTTTVVQVGNVVAQNTYSGSPNQFFEDTLGNRNQGDSFSVQMTIDTFGIMNNYAMTAGEVQSLYNYLVGRRKKRVRTGT